MDEHNDRNRDNRRRYSLEDQCRANWRPDLDTLDENYIESEEGTKEIDNFRKIYLFGHPVFPNMNSEIWRHAPLKFTESYSNTQLKELAQSRQNAEIEAYDSAKKICENDVPKKLRKKNGREPCKVCSSGNTPVSYTHLTLPTTPYV